MPHGRFQHPGTRDGPRRSPVRSSPPATSRQSAAKPTRSRGILDLGFAVPRARGGNRAASSVWTRVRRGDPLAQDLSPRAVSAGRTERSTGRDRGPCRSPGSARPGGAPADRASARTAVGRRTRRLMSGSVCAFARSAQAASTSAWADCRASRKGRSSPARPARWSACPGPGGRPAPRPTPAARRRLPPARRRPDGGSAMVGRGRSPAGARPTQREGVRMPADRLGDAGGAASDPPGQVQSETRGARSGGAATHACACLRASIAAPAMPAWFSSCAGTSSARMLMRGRNLCDFRLTPPPTMIRSGEKRKSMVS